MATSMSPEFAELPSPPIAFDIGVAESTYSVPKRVRERLEQSPESKAPASLEDIEAKLKDADSRRQQFHELLATKARPKRKLDQTSSPLTKDLAERLEARLVAAEQKRLELQAHEQMRLAKQHESRLAAKTEAQLRAEREREELGSKVEFRVQQAETNRMALVEAEKQRRAAANERIAQSILQRSSLEDKDRERTEALRVAICQRIASAEEKRAGLLKAEKDRAQAIVMQARKVAEAVLRERELELMNKKEKLEARLLRAKRQRAEYLQKKGGCRGVCHNHGQKMNKHGDRLSRKLSRCWRQFRRSMKTTYTLAQEFTASGISQRAISSLPFEQVADRITSAAALKSAKALLARFESRLMLSAAAEASEIPKLESLLKRLSPQPRRSSGSSSAGGASRLGKRGAQAPLSKPPKDAPKGDEERYPARVFLCAYMISVHPDAIFSTRGDREAALADAAMKLLPEFEALMTTLIDGPPPSSPPSSPGEAPAAQAQHKPFAAQLVSFDNAWYSYLSRFVAWKVKDAQLLEDDLIRVACQLEVSMLQKCRVGEASALTHDTEAIRRQVLEDQRLLRERIVHITGKAGLEKMEEALLAVRSKSMEAKENGVSLPSPFAYSSPEDLKTSPESGEPPSAERQKPKAARSLFASPGGSSSSAPVEKASEMMSMDPTADHHSGITNERIVNDMMHDGNWKLSDQANPAGSLGIFQAQVRTTLERAFWDTVEERLLWEKPDYTRVVALVGEIREDLANIVPESWKQGLRDSLDLEVLAQVLESGTNDFGHLRQLLDYTLDTIRRLGVPSRDEESKLAQQGLIDDLTKGGETKEAFGRAMLKGIRFVFERLQVLKQDISNARLQSLAQFVNGSAGVEYLQKAFVERHGLVPPVSDQQLLEKLPRTGKWLRVVAPTVEAQKTEVQAALSSLKQIPQQAPEQAFPMCTGGRVGVAGASSSSRVKTSSSEESLRMAPVKWGGIDSIVRLGLLAIVSGAEAATEEQAPETLALNIERLQVCQNDFQSIIVIATGLLLLRQELMMKVPGMELEKIVSEAQQELVKLLRSPVANIKAIGELLAQVCARSSNCEKYADVNACSEFLIRVLERSLSPADPVFERVTAAIRNSLRSVVMMGNGAEGLAMAEGSLKRIGGGVLADAMMSLARKLDRISNISVQVHGAWYNRLV